MEKFTKQIERAKGNAPLLHQVFEEFEQHTAGKLTEADKDRGKVSEVRFLWDHCGHLDYSVACEASQCAVNLTLNGLLGISESLSAFVSTASTARHYGLLTDSITELLLRGQHVEGRHPYIALYEMQPETWPYILQQVSNIISFGVIDIPALKEIKPFVLFILCYGTYQAKSTLWSLLLGKIYMLHNPLLISWMVEAILWHNQVMDLTNCNFFLQSVQQLSEYALARRDEELGRAVAILLIAAMEAGYEKYGIGIHRSVAIIKELNSNFNLYLDPIVIMLSQFLLECPANCYEAVLDLCTHLVKKSFNAHVRAMLQIAVLSVFPYSAKLEPSVIRVVESANQPSLLTSSFPANCDLVSTYMKYLSRADRAIQEALAVANLASRLETITYKRLNKMTSHSQLPGSIFLLKCAMFWQSTELSTFDDIIRHVRLSKKFASTLLTLLLKKLTMPSSGKTKLAILYHLPALAVDKTCVPRVLQIFEALSASQQLQPLQVSLLTELWKAEDRAYPYLEKLLVSDQIHSDEFLMAKASAIDTICKIRPEKYGAELLSVISDLLNTSLGKSNVNSVTIATLSLRSLVSLCRAEVVDLKSVWDLLAPKLNQDHRPSVVCQMCRLLGLAPQLRIDNEEYDAFVHQTISTLFRISFTPRAPEVSISALRSLSKFSKTDFDLKCMPDVCKEDLRIPIKYLPADKNDAKVKAEDVMDYVPGVCWTKLMDSCYEAEVLEKGFSLLLEHLVQEEVKMMPMWVYRKAAPDVTKKNEPTNYSSCLKEDSVLAGLIFYIQKICEINPASRLRMSLTLKVLAGPFEKPLPPLDWAHLQPIVEQYELEAEFLEVVFAQVPHSFSAQSIAENILSRDPLNESLAIVALAHLGSICKALPLNKVQDFVCRLFSNHQSALLPILNRLEDSLTKTEFGVPDEVKQTLASYLQSLVPLLPDDLPSVSRFANCFRLVAAPDHVLCEPSSSTARKQMMVLLMASKRTQHRTASDYLHKALQLSLYVPRLDMELIELVYDCFDEHCKSSPSFLQQFLSFVQLAASRSPTENQNLSRLLDMLCIVVGILSNSVLFSHCRPDNQDAESDLGDVWELFTISLSRLFSQPQWSVVKKNMQDWILAMSESKHASPEHKRRLFHALPVLNGIDKDTFSRILASL